VIVNGTDPDRPYEPNTEYRGQAILGLVARKDIILTKDVPPELEINATLVATEGRITFEGITVSEDGVEVEFSPADESSPAATTVAPPVASPIASPLSSPLGSLFGSGSGSLFGAGSSSGGSSSSAGSSSSSGATSGSPSSTSGPEPTSNPMATPPTTADAYLKRSLRRLGGMVSRGRPVSTLVSEDNKPIVGFETGLAVMDPNLLIKAGGAKAPPFIFQLNRPTWTVHTIGRYFAPVVSAP
jgi:hypothetical protein